jgi:hypothetical protein
MGEVGNDYRILVENQKGRDCSRDVGILEWTERKLGGKVCKWLHLVRDRASSGLFVITVMNKSRLYEF